MIKKLILPALLAGVLVTSGCSDDSESPETKPNPSPTAQPTSGAPNYAASLGQGWALKETTTPMVVTFCGKNVVPAGTKLERSLIDPQKRNVDFAIVKVADPKKAFTTISGIADSCTIKNVNGVISFVAKEPSSLNNGGFAAYIQQENATTGETLQNRFGIVVVPLEKEVLLVKVASTLGDPVPSIDVQTYAELIARNISSAHTKQPTTPVTKVPEYQQTTPTTSPEEGNENGLITGPDYGVGGGE